MKPSVIGGGIGAMLGAVVAVQAHFISHTLAGSVRLPLRYADYAAAGSSAAGIDYDAPVVHQSWWPVLPIAVLGGLVIGVLAVLLWRRRGLRLPTSLYPLALYPLAAAGAALGAVVAVIAHFCAHSLPDTFYSGSYLQEGTSTAVTTNVGPVVRPLWLWSLPISVAVGLLLGLAAAVLLRRVGSRPDLVPAALST